MLKILATVAALLAAVPSTAMAQVVSAEQAQKDQVLIDWAKDAVSVTEQAVDYVVGHQREVCPVRNQYGNPNEADEKVCAVLHRAFVHQREALDDLLEAVNAMKDLPKDERHNKLSLAEQFYNKVRSIVDDSQAMLFQIYSSSNANKKQPGAPLKTGMN